MLEPHIYVRVMPLTRDYDENEIVIVVENGKEFKMRLVEGAFKGERDLRVVPISDA